MKKLAVLAALLSITLMGCKGSGISEQSSSEKQSSEKPREIAIRFSEPAASQFGHTTWEYGFYFEYEDGERIEEYKPIEVKSTDYGIASATANERSITIESVYGGNCVIKVTCKDYKCEAEFPVHVGPDALRSVHIMNAPESIHVDEEYKLQILTTPEACKDRLTPAMLYAEDSELVGCNASNFTIKGLAVGHTTIYLAVSVMNMEGYHGNIGATTSFELDIIA